ncbi:hypothetical protein HanIR_Chr11g0545981 [Helianthus annuus]|nr:hypothetical protein HanIR_Chr11g0545981 [Helianthus annuus]
MSSYITDARPLLWYVRTFMLTRVCNCFPEVLRRCYCGYAQTLYLRNVNVDYRGTGKMALTFGSISKLVCFLLVLILEKKWFKFLFLCSNNCNLHFYFYLHPC